MNARDKRFLCGVLDQGVPFYTSPLGDFPYHRTRWRLTGACKRSHGTDAGVRTYRIETREPDTGADHALVLTVSLGPGIAGVEISVGLELNLPAVDVDDVFGKSEHLVGQLVSPETAPATKGTVQVELTEYLPYGGATFGLVKLRGKILWQAGGHHILRFHRQMPTGWPEGDHHEADESALTGRTEPVGGGAKLYLGVPMFTADRVQVLGFYVDGLDRVVAWTQDATG